MRLLPIASFFVSVAFVACLAPPLSPAARPLPTLRDERSAPHLISTYHGSENDSAHRDPLPDDDRTSGIREIIPEKYLARYQEWKREFLSAETGRQQWAMFEESANFTLTIVMSRDYAEGAGTGGYKWDESGQLVAATITLGTRLNAGYPNPIYFPVMNSLAIGESLNVFDGDVLAAAKMAHEFGHLTRTAKTDSALYQLQSRLMPAYNKIFLSNGRNPGDPRLLALAREMGGTPVEIWEDREYWGEANAMLYLRDRFPEEPLRCQLFHRIKQSVDLYAKSYADRFHQIAQSNGSRKRCGWQ